MSLRLHTPLSVLLLSVLAAIARAQEPAGSAAPEEPAAAREGLPDAVAAKLTWRSIGPANMGGRITSIAVDPTDSSRWWVGTASGGLLKTENNGISFEHLFDGQSCSSIGAVAVAPSDSRIVWAGTGECNPRNSVSWGDGVYKSTDGGRTWKNMGLRGSYQIGAMRIHPKNPDVVYVGALGRLWGPNAERGLFKTVDGGETWEKVLYVNDDTGVIDVAMHPDDPDTLLVATYERRRDGFDANDPALKWGEGSGLYKTTDGGRSFRRITQGLPAVKVGRIGLDFYRRQPNVVYMVLESERIGKEPENAPYMGITGEDADAGARITAVTEDAPAAAAGLKEGDIVLSVAGETVHSYNDFLRQVRRHVAGDTAKLEVSRRRKGVEVEITFGKRPEPEESEEEGDRRRRRGRRRSDTFGTRLGGQVANVEDQQGPEGHDYGGVYKSTDGGDSWVRINSINPRPMYFSEIRVDPSNDDHLWVLGISLHRSKDGGKTFTGDGAGRGVHVDHHALWIDPANGRHLILGNDGGIYVTWDRGRKWDHLNHVAIGQFYDVAVGPRRDYRVHGGLQDNGSWAGPSRVRHGRGPTNADWLRLGGGDGFVCRVDANDADQVYFESQNGAIGRRHLRTGERVSLRPRAPRGTRYRFNWKTPFILSHHNSRIYYTAGNHVFRSLDRGSKLAVISPEITATDRGSATALAESPLDPNLLWVGTDDGAFWVTRDGGGTWTDLYGAAAPPVADAAEVVARAGDGAGDDVTPAAARGGRRPAGFLARLRERDEDGDGRITRDEVPERMQRMFERLDGDGDGAIDGGEMKAAAERFASRGRGQGGGRRGGTAAMAGGRRGRAGQPPRSGRRRRPRRRAACPACSRAGDGSAGSSRPASRPAAATSPSTATARTMTVRSST